MERHVVGRSKLALVAVLTAVLLVGDRPAQAVLGVGDIVFDPANAANMVTQLAKMGVLTARATATLNQVIKGYELAQALRNRDEAGICAGFNHFAGDRQAEMQEHLDENRENRSAAANEALDQFMSGCPLTADARMNLRSIITEQLKSYHEQEAQIDELDDENTAVEEAIDDMQTAEGRWEEETKGASASDGQLLALEAAEIKARARQIKIRDLQDARQVRMSKAETLRRKLHGRIATVSGAREIGQLSLGFYSAQLEMMEEIVASLDEQTKVLESMHTISINQMERERRYRASKNEESAYKAAVAQMRDRNTRRRIANWVIPSS